MSTTFNPRDVSVLINGVRLSDWSDGNDVIQAKLNADAGSYTMGANGTGVFIANPDQSDTLTLKVKQHSPDNHYLDRLFKQQRSTIKTFTPMTLSIVDLLNDDKVSGLNGYFTTSPDYTRGMAHNTTTWTLVFEQLTITLEKGLAHP